MSIDGKCIILNLQFEWERLCINKIIVIFSILYAIWMFKLAINPTGIQEIYFDKSIVTFSTFCVNSRNPYINKDGINPSSICVKNESILPMKINVSALSISTKLLYAWLVGLDFLLCPSKLELTYTLHILIEFTQSTVLEVSCTICPKRLTSARVIIFLRFPLFFCRFSQFYW